MLEGAPEGRSDGNRVGSWLELDELGASVEGVVVGVKLGVAVGGP